ncbi:MAG: VirB3 family type IV secretion system protein [Proteobacteria bacterium]|nr:VirB3 family type IV secretion system protein [Pseudomonadota bacterium]
MADGLKMDPLFVGLTRPPMIFGVSYMFAVSNLMIGMMAYVIMVDVKYLLMMLPIHLIGYMLCNNEPLFIELFRVRAEKCSRCKNRFYHGANSYDQF